MAVFLVDEVRGIVDPKKDRKLGITLKLVRQSHAKAAKVIERAFSEDDSPLHMLPHDSRIDGSTVFEHMKVTFAPGEILVHEDNRLPFVHFPKFTFDLPKVRFMHFMHALAEEPDMITPVLAICLLVQHVDSKGLLSELDMQRIERDVEWFVNLFFDYVRICEDRWIKDEHEEFKNFIARMREILRNPNFAHAA